MDIQELRERLTAAVGRAESINAAAEADDRNLTDEETEEFEAAMAEADALRPRIARAERVSDRKQHLNGSTGRATTADEPLANGDVKVGKARIEDDPRRGWNNLGDFAHAVYKANPGIGGKPDERLGIGAAATGLSQGTGSDGGFLVPPEFSQQIWDGTNSAADSLLARTDSYTVTGESLTFMANAETSRATGSRWGGIRGYWIAEAEQMTKSKPKLRQVKIEPQQLAVFCWATDKLLRNATAVQQWLQRAARDEINFLVGDAILNGDGAGKPTGIVGHNATVSVPEEIGQAASTVVKANIDKMWSRCHANMRSNAVWLINQSVEPQLENLAADVGTGGVPVYLPAGGIADTPNARLKGRPVIVSEYCAALGTVGDIILADLRAYVTGVRGGVQEAMSMHLRFDYNETAFRFIFEADGQPWLASALTPFKGSDTLSPFVTLETRS